MTPCCSWVPFEQSWNCLAVTTLLACESVWDAICASASAPQDDTFLGYAALYDPRCELYTVGQPFETFSLSMG